MGGRISKPINKTGSFADVNKQLKESLDSNEKTNPKATAAGATMLMTASKNPKIKKIAFDKLVSMGKRNLLGGTGVTYSSNDNKKTTLG